VPVIGPNVMGVSELIEDGRSGFLVSPDNLEELIEKIKMLIKDNVLRALFIDMAYEKVIKDFNLKIETDKLLKIWNL
jgi:glycosyltransferase involved in cell wall biosynthesis